VSNVISSKRFIALVSSSILLLFKNSLPITEDQLNIILTTIASLIVGDSINPVGNIAGALKDPRVVAAIVSIVVAFAKDRIGIPEDDLTKLLYLVASLIVGYSVRPPQPIAPVEVTNPKNEG